MLTMPQKWLRCPTFPEAFFAGQVQGEIPNALLTLGDEIHLGSKHNQSPSELAPPVAAYLHLLQLQTCEA